MKLFVQEAAERDILQQIEHYAEQGLSEIARRFGASVVMSLTFLIEGRILDRHDARPIRSWSVCAPGR